MATVTNIGESITSFERKPPDPNAEAEIDSSIKSKKERSDERYSDATPVPFFSLFRHGTTKDKLIIAIGMIVQCLVGLSFAVMNLIFGEVLDDLSSIGGSSMLDGTIGTIKIMALLAVVFAGAAFLGMSAIPYGAARITNRVRNAYVSSVLAQDMTYFDESRPGEIVAALSDYTMDFEEGLSIKLGEGLQATAGGIGGLVVALYFSWQITVSLHYFSVM
jgi:ATP-binding cassette subfamily B (MDR/TAP) protein 1